MLRALQRKEKPKCRPNVCWLVSPSARIGWLPHRSHRTGRARLSWFCPCLPSGPSWLRGRSLPLRLSGSAGWRVHRTANAVQCRCDAHCSRPRTVQTIVTRSDDMQWLYLSTSASVGRCPHDTRQSDGRRRAAQSQRPIPFRSLLARAHSLDPWMCCLAHTRCSIRHTLAQYCCAHWTLIADQRARDVRSRAVG